MASRHKSTHAQHGDSRVEQLRERYGDLADRTVGELQEQARRQGIHSPSGLRKEELLAQLSHGRHGDLSDLTVGDLQQRAGQQGIEGRSGMRKDQLIEALSSRR